MDVALLLPVAAIVLLAGFAFWLYMLIDALRRPAAEWEAADQNQVVHIVVIVVLGFIGAIVYAVVARPRLQAIARR
jgi:uncharacterized membrane protein YqaE (UPF0057 family)